jgi:hypothetical protein
MFGGAPTFSALYWGFDEANLFLRLDPDPEAAPPDRIRVTLLGPLVPSRLEFEVAKDGVPRPVRRDGAEVGRAVLLKVLEVEIPVAPDGVGRPGRKNGDEVGRAVQVKVLEIELPLAPLGIQAGEELVMSVEAFAEGVEVERIPRSGYLPLSVPGADFERIHWRV